MKYPRHVTFLVSACLVIAIAACDDGGGTRIVGEDGSTIDVTTATATATPSADVSPTSIPPEGTSVPSTTETATPDAAGPDATGTATPTATPGDGDIEEYEGVPYSTSDVQAAVESAGRTFIPADHDISCQGTSVPGGVFWAANAGGSDYGPNWALWIYPDADAREADWSIEDGVLESQVEGCELATGFNYFNENAVLAFISWSGPGFDSPYDPDRSPGEDAAKEAFIAMGANSD